MYLGRSTRFQTVRSVTLILVLIWYFSLNRIAVCVSFYKCLWQTFGGTISVCVCVTRCPTTAPVSWRWRRTASSDDRCNVNILPLPPEHSHALLPFLCFPPRILLLVCSEKCKFQSNPCVFSFKGVIHCIVLCIPMSSVVSTPNEVPKTFLCC